MKLTHLSLFSGIGGLDLAAEMAGFETVGQCEWAPYPAKVLEKHWPCVPRWRDIRTLTKESFCERTGLRTVDIISGGFPCQPFSSAGKQRGKDDDRYLWPEMLRVISSIRPSWVIGENVPGIINLALDQVLSDLENIGYTGQALSVPACAVDAPHRRNRIAILAYSDCDGCKRSGSKFAERRDITQECASFSVGSDVCNANGAGLQITRHERELKTSEQKNGASVADWWPAEPGVGRVAHGIPNRVDRIRCLGNAVVPQQFYPFFKYIHDIEEARL